jgi:arsenate reductase
MAEAWANHHGKGRVRAHSAGSHPYGSIVHDTYTVMSEKGVSLEDHCSKGLRDVALEQMDVVVAMGHEVACPLPEGFNGRKIEWNIPDPYGEGIEFFRTVRDMIERQVVGLLAEVRTQRASA